jgi:hypothetical protein
MKEGLRFNSYMAKRLVQGKNEDFCCMLFSLLKDSLVFRNALLRQNQINRGKFI